MRNAGFFDFVYLCGHAGRAASVFMVASVMPRLAPRMYRPRPVSAAGPLVKTAMPCVLILAIGGAAIVFTGAVHSRSGCSCRFRFMLMGLEVSPSHWICCEVPLLVAIKDRAQAERHAFAFVFARFSRSLRIRRSVLKWFLPAASALAAGACYRA